MKKYIKPVMDIHLISPKAMMITASGNNQGILGDGGNASTNNITDAGAKRRRGIFTDDFEPEQESLIW